jgi:hypothetical protein
MYVELIYSPGCSYFKKALQTLETIIAEERLPISIEVKKALRATRGADTLVIKIDGYDVKDLLKDKNRECCKQHQKRHGVAGALCVDHLRDVMGRKWKELTEYPMIMAMGQHSSAYVAGYPGI